MKNDLHAQAFAPSARHLCLVKTHAHWTPDLDDASVMHESGLVLSLVQLPVPDQARRGAGDMQTLDMVWLPGGYPVWAVMADAAALDDTLRAFQVGDDRAAQLLLSTLAREGGGVWVQAWVEAQKLAQHRQARDMIPDSSGPQPNPAD